VNRWWITDEVRYGWKFVHSEDRLRSPMRRQFGVLVESDYTRAYAEAVQGLRAAVEGGGRIALVVSPMLPCEEAFALAMMARAIDPQAILAVGPVPRRGEDQSFPPNAPEDKAFRVHAEKAPNARGVRRVLREVAGQGAHILSYEELVRTLAGPDNIRALILTGNYPEPWADDALMAQVDRARRGPQRFVVLIDTLSSPLVDDADVVLPGATFAEKAGTFENARGMLQAFEAAIPVLEFAKPEGQIANDLLAVHRGERGRPAFPDTIETPAFGMEIPATMEVAAPKGRLFLPAQVREEMAQMFPALSVFTTHVAIPDLTSEQPTDMQMVEL
jgi:NADH-quinone oxidoreductase subunit G